MTVPLLWKSSPVWGPTSTASVIPGIATAVASIAARTRSRYQAAPGYTVTENTGTEAPSTSLGEASQVHPVIPTLVSAACVAAWTSSATADSPSSEGTGVSTIPGTASTPGSPVACAS